MNFFKKDIFNIYKSKQFEESFNKELEKQITNAPCKDEIYNKIITCYVNILGLLRVNSFSSFSFPDYNNCRRVVVDGNEYNLDNEFCHNNSKATEILSTIDNMMSDLGEATETILKKTEISITDKLTKN